MTALPLGVGAYKRASYGMPEVKCINRFVEETPTNLREQVALLARPGTEFLENFPFEEATQRVRGTYSQRGVFGSDLFVISGPNLYRYDGETRTQIAGEISGDASPRVAFVAAPGYERMFIADGLLLNYYDGPTPATGTLTDSDAADYEASVIEINGAYYGWNTDVDDDSPDGTESNPFWCLPGSGTEEALENMAGLLNFDGEPGTDFSSTLTAANPDVTAGFTSDTLTLTSRQNTEGANSITTTVDGDADLEWSDDTLTGGGTHALQGVEVPDGQAVLACASLNEYVFVGVTDSARFYYIRPTETEIDPLNFATKESSPDPIHDLVRVGDVMTIFGAASTEFWSATGNADNPFAPTQGRTMSRGAVEGTPVMIDEGTVMFVGNDWKVYSAGSSMTRVSDHGIEERIRRQLRREAGL